MSIHDKYDVGPLLGKGGFALVHSARHRGSGKRVALKVIQTTHLSKMELSRVHREVNVHKEVSKEGHPNIVKLIETYADSERVYIVLEYCSHGDLYKLLRKQGAFPESQARDIVCQLLQGLAFLHDNNVVHR
jgi:serine/threonine protein kinase